MYKSKPITILRTFSKRDLRKFDDFIASPFFNKDKEGKLLQLYAILKANHPIYTPTNVDRNKVFQVLFPTYTIEKEEQNENSRE